MLFVCRPKILHKYCLQFLFGHFNSNGPRETEHNAYAKFWVDRQTALWYVMVFSRVVNCTRLKLRPETSTISSKAVELVNFNPQRESPTLLPQCPNQ